LKTKGLDIAGKELKGMDLVKSLHEKAVVTLTTESIDGQIVGESGKAEMAKEIRIVKEK
jgi:hypothetical protein